MSAASQSVPRKPTQRLASVPLDPVGGYVKVPHEVFALLRWVPRSHTAHLLLEKFISEANKRDAILSNLDLPTQGRTRLLLTCDLMEDLPADLRMGQVALNELLDEDLPALRRITRAQAKDAGILLPQEAKASKRESQSYMYELVMENWKAIAARNRQEWEERQQARREALEARNDEPEVVEVAEDEPLILLPGAGQRPMVMSDVVRRGLSIGLPVEADFGASFPISIQFSALGSVIRCSIHDVSGKESDGTKRISHQAQPQNVGEQNLGTKCIAYHRNDKNLQDLAEFLEDIWHKYLPGDPLVEATLAQILSALGDCPITAPMDQASYGRTIQVSFRKPPKTITGGFFVWLAEMAQKDWVKGLRQPRRVESPAEMTLSQAKNFLDAPEGDVPEDLLAEAKKVIQRLGTLSQ